MALETATYLNGLVSSNPAGADSPAQGDDHLRLIKSTLLATFPNFTAAALAATQAQIDAAVAYSVRTQSLMAAGTTALPTYSYTLDPNTGWYNSSANVQTASCDGVDIVSIGPLGINMVAGGLYRAGTAVFPLVAADIGTAAVTTAKVQDAAITLAKMANLSGPSVLIGRKTAGAGAPEEITLGANLTMTAGVLIGNVGAVGSYSKLSIKVATNTTVDVLADAVTVTDGTSVQQLTGLSATLNLGTNGAVNTLDAGTVAVSTWYHVFAIAKADGTKGVLGSTSSTAPTLPTGYTFKKRLGAVRTIAGSATLYGTWQINNLAQFIVGLAQTAVLPVMATGNSGSPSTGVYTALAVGAFVPPTASSIEVLAVPNNTPSIIAVAPNNSYGSYLSATNPPPIGATGGGAGSFISLTRRMLLESTNIYYGIANDSGATIRCLGWEEPL